MRRAAQFLVARQKQDGRFEEDQTITDVAPPWVQPDDLAATLYLTANCGYWLALLGQEEAARRAGRFLTDHLQKDGSLPSFPHAHWLAAGLSYRAGQESEAGAVLGHLATLLPGLAASNLAWLATTLRDAGVPSRDPLLQQTRQRLSRLQDEDGRWSSEDGPERDVHTTLEAMAAFSDRRGDTPD